MHRYAALLYKQPSGPMPFTDEVCVSNKCLSNRCHQKQRPEPAGLGTTQERYDHNGHSATPRRHWDVQAFAEKYGLGDPVGLKFFR